MKILITGSMGTLGTPLVKELIRRGLVSYLFGGSILPPQQVIKRCKI